MSLHVQLCACTRAVPISCALLHPVMLIEEWFSLVVISSFSQLLLSFLLASSIKALHVLLSRQSRVFFIWIHYPPQPSYTSHQNIFCLLPGCHFNKNITLNWPAWLSDEWFADWKAAVKTKDKCASPPTPPIIITSWTLAHTHTHHIHPSTDQQIRSGMLNLCVAEGPCKKSLGHQWRLFWKALSWKAFWDDSRSTEIAPVEEHTTVRAGGWRGDIHTTCPQGTWAHTHTSLQNSFTNTASHTQRCIKDLQALFCYREVISAHTSVHTHRDRKSFFH